MDIYFIILAIVILTIFGGVLAIRMRDRLHLILGYSAGAILGVALIDLIPESLELTSDILEVYVVMAIVTVGFSAMMLLDRLLSLHQHDSNHAKLSHKGSFGSLTLVMHSFFDGFSIGLAFRLGEAIGWMVAIAVLVHKFSDGIAIASVNLANSKKQKTVYNWIFISAVAPVLGVVFAQFSNFGDLSFGVLLAMFAGMFIYISTNDLIPESHHNHPTIWTSLATLLGIATIALITFVF